jgi:hypothetical protein
MENSKVNLVDLDHTAQNQGEHSNDQPANDDVVESAEGLGSSDHIPDGATATGTAPDEGNTGSTGTATPTNSGG